MLGHQGLQGDDGWESPVMSRVFLQSPFFFGRYPEARGQVPFGANVAFMQVILCELSLEEVSQTLS